jgi:hypothetical protein
MFTKDLFKCLDKMEYDLWVMEEYSKKINEAMKEIRQTLLELQGFTQ